MLAAWSLATEPLTTRLQQALCSEPRFSFFFLFFEEGCEAAPHGQNQPEVTVIREHTQTPRLSYLSMGLTTFLTVTAS